MLSQVVPAERRAFHIIAAAAILVACLPTVTLHAQGLGSASTVDAIVGTSVDEEVTRAVAEPERVIAAIERAGESIDIIRKTTALDRLDIVFVTDAAITEGGPPEIIQLALDKHRDAIASLRTELEGNAMLYHALDSRQVLMRDVLAVEFEDDRHAIIFVAAPDPS